MNTDGKYTMPYAVASSVIDAESRLSPLGIVQLTQDLAAADYAFNGLSIPHLQRRGLTWVLVKQRFEIDEYPLWLDNLTLSTWAKAPRGLFCFRDFEGVYAPGGRRYSVERPEPENGAWDSSPAAPFFRGTSNWMVLDTETGKPVKPAPEVMGPLTFCGEDVLPPSFPKIVLPDVWDVEVPVTASILDIDLNSHVNNVNYVRWVLSHMPPSVYEGRLISVLDTYFMTSAKLGDELICRAAGDGQSCVHSIVRVPDGAEVFRAKTEWKDKALLSRELVLG